MLENLQACFLFYILILIYFFLNMKPLSVEMARLLGIQNEIQAVCIPYYHSRFYISQNKPS